MLGAIGFFLVILFLGMPVLYHAGDSTVHFCRKPDE